MQSDDQWRSRVECDSSWDCRFAAMHALSTRNEELKSKQTYDTGRDGFVMGRSRDADFEEYEFAKQRGARTIVNL